VSKGERPVEVLRNGKLDARGISRLDQTMRLENQALLKCILAGSLRGLWGEERIVSLDPPVDFDDEAKTPLSRSANISSRPISRCGTSPQSCARNIGVEAYRIKNATYPPAEIAVRFSHRLVAIHPFFKWKWTLLARGRRSSCMSARGAALHVGTGELVGTLRLYGPPIGAVHASANGLTFRVGSAVSRRGWPTPTGAILQRFNRTEMRGGEV
jgi:hypothetical protein